MAKRKRPPPRKPRNRQVTGKPGGKRRTSWKPGIKSPNPKGRPALPPEYKAALKVLEPAALAVLDEVLADAAHPRREQAAEYIVNRARGTPRTRTEVATPPGKPLEVKVRTAREMTTEERQKRLADLLGKAGTAAALAAGGGDRAEDDDEPADDDGAPDE